MKKFVLAAAAAALLPTSVLAADLPSRRAPPVFVPPPVPVFTWTGFYVGANAGYAFDAGTSSTITGNDAVRQGFITNGIRPGFGHIHNGGFTGGGQIGYNYQLGSGVFGNLGGTGNIVIGAEADAAYTDLHGTGSYVSDRISTFSSRTNFIGTVRGRLGYAFDNILVYGTGGFAYGDVRHDASLLNPAGLQTYQGHTNSIRTGYAYGGGVEVAIPTSSFLNVFHSSAVTVKAEYLRYDLGTTSTVISNNANIDPGYTQRVRASGNLVRAGLNYKFESFTPPPVVARY